MTVQCPVLPLQAGAGRARAPPFPLRHAVVRHVRTASVDQPFVNIYIVVNIRRCVNQPAFRDVLGDVPLCEEAMVAEESASGAGGASTRAGHHAPASAAASGAGAGDKKQKEKKEKPAAAPKEDKPKEEKKEKPKKKKEEEEDDGAGDEDETMREPPKNDPFAHLPKSPMVRSRARVEAC